MATDTSDPEVAAQATLDLLQTRLHRLEFLLSGGSNDEGIPEPLTPPTHNDETIWARLDSLAAEMAKLKQHQGTAGEVVRNVERLSSTYPDIFSPATGSSGVPKSEDLSTLASIVLAHASLFPETASRLSSLQTLQVPSAQQSSKLASLIPRLAQCKETEQSLEVDIRELRERSARCLEWWVKVGVIGTGDLYEDWERRIHEIERHLIRSERRAREEEGYFQCAWGQEWSDLARHGIRKLIDRLLNTGSCKMKSWIVCDTKDVIRRTEREDSQDQAAPFSEDSPNGPEKSTSTIDTGVW